MKFKKENVYILKRKNHETVKQLVPARTFEYKGHKFNLQGDSKTGYSISDNVTGMLIGAYFEKLKDIEKYYYILDKFIDITNIKGENTIYKDALKKIEKARIVEV